MKQIKNRLFVFCLLSCLTFAFAQQKQNLSVLYVGYDPSIPLPEKVIKSSTGNGGMTEERFIEDYKTRFPEFKGYLEKYFTKVKTVDARDYKQEMSTDYDVTIFDQTIEPWKERILEQKPDGTNHYEPAKYLTDDFDRATIFIGHTAPVMGHSVGSKLDWLCLCLDANAHHIKTEHPIFKGPFPVKLTFETKPTPEGIFHYPSGKNVPKETPMWRVQKEGYIDGKGYRVGMVARGDGFSDSPDTEYISSGVNTKDVGAVAIGRHGNFFMWGFSGSPDYMTDEAEQVFANAVVYMKQFKGQKPIARKYNDRIATKDYIDNIVGRLNKESFEDTKVYYEQINKQMAETVRTLNEKKDKGETLTEMDEAILKAQSKPMPIPSWDEYVQQTSREFYKPEYKDNIEALKTFLIENRKYMYSEPDAFYNLQIDEELKSIGVGNDTLEFFERAIPLLKDPNLSDEATIVLKRYTDMEKSQKEWEQWYKMNKKKLFFTESGGFKWMIDTTK
jgi:hypothetical protein